MQPLVGAGLVAGLAVRGDAERVVQELYTAAPGLGAILLLEGFGLVQQGLETAGAGHQQVAQMLAQGAYEMQGVEALVKDFVEQHKGGGIVAGQEGIHQTEAVLVVQHSEVTDNVFVLDVGATESYALVEQGEGVAHGAVGLLGYHMDALVVYLYSLSRCYGLDILGDIRDGDAVEVVGLAAGKYRGQNLVLLRGAEDEHCVGRRFLEGFEEGVEGLRGEHVDLVDDVHAVAPHLRRDLYLLQKGADVVHAIVGRGVELVDVVRAAFLERQAGFAFAAGLHILPRTGTVDGFGEDAGGAGFTHSAGAAEKVCMCQLTPLDGVLEGAGDIVLTNEGLERVGPVFSC